MRHSNIFHIWRSKRNYFAFFTRICESILDSQSKICFGLILYQFQIAVYYNTVLYYLNIKLSTAYSYHDTYVFQSESTLYCCLNFKALLARSRRKIWSLSDYKWTRTQNHLTNKRTLNHLAKLAIWPNGWVFDYELSGFGFESICSHIKLSIHNLIN